MMILMRTLFVLFFAASLSAQQPPPPDGAKARPPDGAKPRSTPPQPKNLKVLKIPVAQLIPTMRAYTAALGTKCDLCHVQGDFASDEKAPKEMARKMIVMTDELNTKFPDDKVHVTCYTCHRGDTEPKTAPRPAPADKATPKA